MGAGASVKCVWRRAPYKRFAGEGDDGQNRSRSRDEFDICDALIGSDRAANSSLAEFLLAKTESKAERKVSVEIR